MNPEWVEAGARALVGGTNYVMSGDNGVAGTMNRLTAEFVIRAVEPLIRADEREQVEQFVMRRVDRTFIGRDYAEAVAARLVEVICEQDILLREWVRERKRLQRVMDALLRQRDAARVDADYCTGCDLPLTRCLAHHGESGGKCCPECKHPAEAQAFTTLRARAQALERECSSQVLQLANLRAQIAAEIEDVEVAPQYPGTVGSNAIWRSDAIRIARGESK